ncbi:MAG: hypothetical protein ABI389_16225 [Rhodanobacter sp.]
MGLPLRHTTQIKRTECVRRAAMGMLIAANCIVLGCSSKQAPDQAPVPSTSQSPPPSDVSYLPQVIFGPQAVAGATVLKPLNPHSLAETELKYSTAPRRSSAVEYQPGVIIMDHGDQAIHPIASNGLEWHFDASAPHVSEFHVDKIVLATGRAVGRIISLRQEGDTVAVILARSSSAT